MAHNNNYSTPDPLRLPSIRSLDVYPASNTNNNNNASVDYAQQQQQVQQSQVRYSEEYYSQSNRDMGYYGHDPSNASNTTPTTTASTGAQAASQTHPHSSSNNSTSNSGSGPNDSPYRRPRTLTSNLNSHGTMNNAKYNSHPHTHHHSSISTASGSGAGSSASVSTANSGSQVGATGTTAGSGQSHRSSSYNSTYPGQSAYPGYYTQRGSAATTTPTTATAGSAGANTGATSWYYAQNPNSSHSQSQTMSQSQQPTASPVMQQKPNTMHSQSQHYAHTASPSQSPVSSLPQQQQQQYYQQSQIQGQNQSSYSQSTMHGHSNPAQSQQQNATRTPRFQSSSLHPSGGVYATSNNDSPTTTTHHGHHMTIPSMNSSSSLTGGNGNAPAPISASPAPTSTNTGLIQNFEEDANRAAAEGMHLNKILEHCEVIRTFADHYAHQTQIEGSPASNSATPPATNPSAGNTGPTPPEMSEMYQRASIVFKLVDQMRRVSGANVNIPGFSSIATAGGMAVDEDSLYKKKRGWGDEDGSGNVGEDIESLAYHDMAHIRNKRAQGVGNNTAPGGNAKAKYRKRSRATPPGKCHSCNIRETPEWRRGPDGARTLCNACGLHYAKLIRKRDKTVGTGNVDLPPISVEMLRASTRADSAKHHITNVSGSIPLSGVGATSSASGTSGSGTTGLGPPGSAASPSGNGSNGSSSEMTEIALQPIGAPPSHSATASSSGVTLSPVSSSNVSLTGPGRSNSGGNGGGLQHPHQWSSSANNVYRYSGPDSSSSVSGGAGSSSYHSHSSAHSSSHHPHVHSLPPPPHHQALHLPHPLQRSGGYDSYSTSLMRTSAPVGGDGRGSPGV